MSNFFNKTPYTDFHELNLDWLLERVNNIKDHVKGMQDDIIYLQEHTPDMDDYYDKTETDALLANKADVSDLPDMTDYYDKTETDALLADKADVSSLATVATTGDYDDLINIPTIPAAQVNSDWNAISGVSQILNKPTIPTVNDATLTIQQNGTSVSTFTANASSNVTANITCENKITWTNSGNWHYWIDSNNVKHLHYNASLSKEYSGNIGSLKYVSSPEVIALPVSISNIYSIQATVQFTSDICGAAIHSYSSNSISVWLWSCVTGTKSIRLHIDITGL